MLKTKKEKIDIFFAALKSALIDQPKAPKHQSYNKNGALKDEMGLKVIETIRNQPDISQKSIDNHLGTSQRRVAVLCSGSRVAEPTMIDNMQAIPNNAEKRKMEKLCAMKKSQVVKQSHF